MAPVVRAASLRGFVPLVRELGADPQSYLRRFGIPAAVLSSDDGLLPITEHDLMLDTAAHELDCPDFGLRLASAQDLSVLGPLALAIESSSTVAEALQCASRFMFVHSPALSISIEPDPRGAPGVIAVTYRKDLRESVYSPQAMELGVGLLHRVGASLLGSLRGLRSVQLPHAPLSPVSRYLDFFGVDVKFGCSSAALRLEQQLLDTRFDHADLGVRQLAVEYLAQEYPDPSGMVSVQVRHVLAGSLGVAVAVPTVTSTARLLQLHPRTLQRRLAREGTTHASILDDVRREAARRLIVTTDVPLTQVGVLVGFSEQSTLTHAVRRWFGVSPRQLRAPGVPSS